MEPILTQEFTGSTECLPRIREFVRTAAATLGAGDEAVFACELATDEAASNAFVHAYRHVPGRIVVEVAREGLELRVTVRDWGLAFDPASYRPPDLEAPLEERRPGGLGLFLIRHLMGEVGFTFDRVEGNALVMRRSL